MSILKPRTRIVYFRVSEEDFHRLVDLCPARGARSISELARSAMQSIIRGEQGETADREVVETLHAIDRTVSEMNQNLKRLMPASSTSDNGKDNA
ncbi:MAG: hypothetical protein JNM66_11160 [Bryobacterales bacterium]|nr:hypothetical protein [Bryobacterales bacterium]